MKISVIVPIFNVVRFLEKAVSSVLSQAEVAELLLVDDGSQDGSLALATSLASGDTRVRVLTHESHANRGAAATRNLGMRHAKYETIAFLDADDYYLPGRFAGVRDLLGASHAADGVYEAVGTHAYDAVGLALHRRRMSNSVDAADPMLTTMDQPIAPSALFEALLLGTHGFFHIDGLTLKRSALEKAGLLDEELVTGVEDKEWFLRLSLRTTLVPGRLSAPVAMRGVYEGNGILSVYTNQTKSLSLRVSSCRLYRRLFLEMLGSRFSRRVNRRIIRLYLEHYSEERVRMKDNWTRQIVKVHDAARIVLQHPRILALIF